jgi:pyruvate dehydrogenase E2 component (dihydrolipoamide acetyltransferase)
MATEIIAPKLGMGTEPLTIVEWKFKEGERVDKGSVVLIVETEKIRHDVEAEATGFLHIVVDEGHEAAIGSAAGLIAESEEELAKLQSGAGGTPANPTATAAEPEAKEAPPAKAPAPAKVTAGGERIRISPVARKMAEEHLIDITQVVGTGPEGRIVKEDIEKAVAAKKGAPVAEGVAPATAGETYQGRRIKSTKPLTGTRKAIAEHMHRSLQISAQLTSMGEIDMTEMVKLRQALVKQEETLGTRITYTDLLVFIVARLLKDYPLVNASIIDNEIKVWEDINVAVAVALDEGLIVPVVKNADQKSLVEISKEVKTLASKARERKLAPEEVQGGTLTVTNLGAVAGGYRFETVIINQPESAILGTGGITDRAVVRDGQVVIRPIMTYYFTYDHRLIDGATAARFMGDLIRLIEIPGLLAV